MMRATRMASAKIKARAKGTFGFLKSSEVRPGGLGLGFAARGGADRSAMVVVDL